MSSPRQASRIRTIALLLSGVLPLAIQPSALAGQIAASRNVDRMVGELPKPISVEELIRLLGRSGQDESEPPSPDAVPGDVMAVIVQCKLMSLMSDSAALQAPDVESTSPAIMPTLGDIVLPLPHSVGSITLGSIDTRQVSKRLSDEQPLGP